MNMKKTVLASAILLSMGATGAQAASIDVTTMKFYDATGAPGFFGGGLNTSVAGTVNDSNTGSFNDNGVGFFGTPWVASQQMFDNTVSGSTANWSGVSASGAFSYDYTLTADQTATGVYFNWGAAVDIAVLAIFDCDINAAAGTACGSVYTEGLAPQGTIMKNGPFAGQHATFEGEVSAVPVPAAVWLFGSGLLGLVGVARRKKQA